MRKVYDIFGQFIRSLRLVSLVLLSFGLMYCNNHKKSPDKEESVSIMQEQIEEMPYPEPSENQEEKKEMSVVTYFTDSLGWGYDIYLNGSRFVHQPHIPAIDGIIGFDSEADAMAVAKLMTRKIANDIIPPGVSRAELDSLKIVINY